MLTYLHVKNLALIEETEIDFGTGLNILTGETGAGKSILMGSVNLALGGKAGADVIGRYGESALVELGFRLTNEQTIKALNEMDIFPEDGSITITRRILPGHSAIKINGETVTASLIKKITADLIDIHGQHDHQSLLYKSNHLAILDKFAKSKLQSTKDRLELSYKEYMEHKKSLERFTMSEEERSRAVSFLRFEIDEIEKADLKPLEDQETEEQYRKILNARKITEQLETVTRLVGGDEMGDASDHISRALHAISQIAAYDKELEPLLAQLTEIDNLLNDFNHDLKNYISGLDFEEAEFWKLEKRLDLLNSLKHKYGNSIESVGNYLTEAYEKLAFYEDYETKLQSTQKQLEDAYKEVCAICKEITTIRCEEATRLSDAIKESLLDLNFLQVQFQVEIREKEPSKNGADEVEFLISLNPGEELKPLSKIASGGEMSRIMLGIKSVLAGKDDIESLIFDEIDTGISGRTAQKVAEKMSDIAKTHQVICITHLPQIAAMADTHFLIEKSSETDSTKTTIVSLGEDAMVAELARMLGGLEITDIVTENASQMKSMAHKHKTKNGK